MKEISPDSMVMVSGMLYVIKKMERISKSRACDDEKGGIIMQHFLKFYNLYLYF